jgi:serine/threonine protein kinase
MSYLFKNYAEAGNVGAGGFGAVVKVFDEESGDAFAAKVFEPSEDSDCTSEALRELSFMSLLTQSHAPHCIALQDFSYELSTRRGLVAFMPLMTRDLSHAIDSSDLKASARLRISRDVFTALAYLHGASPAIVHRDVKPENVLLDSQNRASLTDFSFTRFVSDGMLPPEKSKKRKSKDVSKRSSEGSGVLGTPTYIAPEVFAGVPPHPAVDCWAAGVVLLELFQNSRLPVDRDKAALKILRQTRDSLGSKPVPSLIKGLLEERPEQRTSAAAALKSEALSSLKADEVAGEPLDYFGPAEEIPPEVAKVCRKLQASVPQTFVAASHYKSMMRGGKVELLCVIACKMYEHNPESDEELLESVSSSLSLEDLMETQEQLLTVMRGCLLVPFARGSR